MNAVNGCGPSLTATTILRLSPDRPMRPQRNTNGDETLLAGVRFPPRSGDARRLGDLLPDVLACYGIAAPPRERARGEALEAVA